MGWLSKLFNLELDGKESSRPYSAAFGRTSGSSNTGAKQSNSGKQGEGSKSDAYNRLKLVLMHDRTQISPDVLSKMRDELVQVISKYVDIDREALELNLETESNTIALVANIPVMRMKPTVSETPSSDATTVEPAAETTPAATATASDASSSTTATTASPVSSPAPVESTVTTKPASAPLSTAPTVTSSPLTQPTLKAPVATATPLPAAAAPKANPFGGSPAPSATPSVKTPVKTP